VGYEWGWKEGWRALRDKLDKKDAENSVNILERTRARQVMITQGIQNALVERLKAKNLDVSVMDGIRAMEHELKLVAPELYAQTSAAVKIENNGNNQTNVQPVKIQVIMPNNIPSE
jgi:hypothetical protein